MSELKGLKTPITVYVAVYDRYQAFNKRHLMLLFRTLLKSAPIRFCSVFLSNSVPQAVSGST